MRNKLENRNVLEWIHEHDIVFLGEIKSGKPPCVPGFRSEIAKNDEPSRGGLAVLLKNHIATELSDVDRTVNEQVWFSINSLPNIRFCGAYIAPSNSMYSSMGSVANFQAKTTDYKKQYIIAGDLNARFGSKLHELAQGDPTISYNPVDLGENDNGKSILQICKDQGLCVVNNLETQGRNFKGDLTYKKRKKWISEIDVCLISKTLLPNIISFSVNKGINLPSDHAPVSLKVFIPESSVDMKELVSRSNDLGGYDLAVSQKKLCYPEIPYKRIDTVDLANQLSRCIPSLDHMDVDEAADLFSKRLYECIENSNRVSNDSPVVSNSLLPRWQRILECEDDATLWKAIDWKGEFNVTKENTCPSEMEFQDHLERLLNPPLCEKIDISGATTTIPILDNDISISEVKNVINKQIKPNKTCGPDGISPGVFKFLPATWIMVLCTLFNMVFALSYPLSWVPAKLIMIFKKGYVLDCDNYRGISIINAIAKIYDYVLNNRLMLWYKPHREQAGAQSKRGCIEHVVCLRLIFDMFMRKRCKLFVAFIDFSKAYDRVPRSKMFHLLKNLGCGVVMLAALAALYSVTTSILGSTIINSNIGVRQGSPTSCLLFIIFVDVLIRRLKQICNDERFLGWLHVLMLMDDTVIIATSKEKLLKKLKILDGYCTEYGMVLNESKTKFMAVNGDVRDRSPIILSDATVKHCDQYTYLGVIFTANGRAEKSLMAQLEYKRKELNKFIIFLATNYDAPFNVKKRVFDAAFRSSILYGCESWLKVPLRSLETFYMKAVKSLLGVRITTSNKLCLIEAGLQPIKCIILERQQKFFLKMMNERAGLKDDPLMHILKQTQLENHVMWRYIESIMHGGDFISEEIANIKGSVTSAANEKSKLCTYRLLNPQLEIHPLYVKCAEYIPDYLRIDFTRFRLSSHKLRVETGRWNSIPREQRICNCGEGVQDEFHIFCCRGVSHILTSYGKQYTSPIELFSETKMNDLKMLHDILVEIDELNNPEV